MALNDFRSAVLTGRARKPVAKPAPRVVPELHLKSRDGAYFDDGNDPMVFKHIGWEIAAIIVWVLFLVATA